MSSVDATVSTCIGYTGETKLPGSHYYVDTYIQDSDNIMKFYSKLS